VLATVAVLLTAPAAGAQSPAPAATGCPSADVTAANTTVTEFAAGVRCLLNEQRAAAGTPAVAHDARLGLAARRHAADMVARHYFAHTTLGGRTLVDRVRRTGYLPWRGRWSAGELLSWASGAQATPRGIVDAWMASAEHRRTLLDRGFSDVGVGVVFGAPQTGAGAGAVTVAADLGRVG
jgi:uncharacterized protein YkwD